MRLLSLTLLAVMSLGNLAQASGFKCEERGGSLEVILINHVHPELGTRNPAKLVVGTRRRTLLHRRGPQIRKLPIDGGVQYRAEGNRRIDADEVLLQIDFQEGKDVLEKGEWVSGRLILVRDEERDRLVLDCYRYLRQG